MLLLFVINNAQRYRREESLPLFTCVARHEVGPHSCPCFVLLDTTPCRMSGTQHLLWANRETVWQFVWQAVKGQLAARDCLGNRHRVERQPSSDDLPTRRRLVLSTRCAGRDIGCDQVWTLPRGSPSKTSLQLVVGTVTCWPHVKWGNVIKLHVTQWHVFTLCEQWCREATRLQWWKDWCTLEVHGRSIWNQRVILRETTCLQMVEDGRRQTIFVQEKCMEHAFKVRECL